jgi:hypothetical protein
VHPSDIIPGRVYQVRSVGRVIWATVQAVAYSRVMGRWTITAEALIDGRSLQLRPSDIIKRREY